MSSFYLVIIDNHVKNLTSAEDVVRFVRGQAASPSIDTRLPSKSSVSSPPEIIDSYDQRNDFQQRNPSTSSASSPPKVKM